MLRVLSYDNNLRLYTGDYRQHLLFFTDCNTKTTFLYTVNDNTVSCS